MTKIIGGSNCRKIAHDLSVHLNIEYIEAIIARFADQELRVQIPEALYAEDVIIVQSTCNPANDNLMELLLLIDTVRRAGSRRVIAVMPYFGYSRQDQQSYEWGPLATKLVARILEAAGVDHIITLDLHSKQSECFFNIGVQNIDLISLFTAHLEQLSDVVVISPDVGGLVRARKFANLLHADLAVINKTRDGYNSCEMDMIVGNVSGKNCVIIDDIIDTGDTICKAVRLLERYDALSTRAVATHAVLSGDAKQRLVQASICSIITTDSIPQVLSHNKFTVLNVTPTIANTIKFLKLL